MNPGTLDRRITIQKRTITRDSFGDAVESWADWRTSIPARQIYRSGGESFGASEQRVATRTVVFRIRYLSLGDVLDPAAYRITFGGQVYDVRAIEEFGRRAYLDLVAEYRSTVE